MATTTPDKTWPEPASYKAGQQDGLWWAIYWAGYQLRRIDPTDSALDSALLSLRMGWNAAEDEAAKKP